MTRLICDNCGFPASLDTVAIFDYCPRCEAEPFIEKEENESCTS